MVLELVRDGYMVTVRGAAEAPFEDLRAALDELTAAYETRVVVFDLTGEAPGASAFAADQLLWLERYPIPLIAAVAGRCGGPVLSLAMSCDVRVTETGTTFSFASLGERRMHTLIRSANALRLLAQGRQASADDAIAMGIVSACVGEGGALAEAQRKAGLVASRGPIATRLGKEAIWRGLPQPLEQALRFETDLTMLLQTTKDRAEGVAAFLEKREPLFTGK